MNYETFKRLLNRSKSYEFNGSVLRITDYQTGKSVELDLGELSEEAFEEIVVEDDEEEKRKNIYRTVCELQQEHEGVVDGFAWDITQDIIEDNGLDLSEDDVKELAEQYFEEEDN